jgi:hypothetical protein
MFCNTCILFSELSFFGLGPELETDQASQPATPPCPPNLARKDKGWVEMEVQSWDLHCCILCKMVVDRAFEGGAWFGGKNAISWMEKDENLQGMIQSTHCVYAQ